MNALPLLRALVRLAAVSTMAVLLSQCASSTATSVITADEVIVSVKDQRLGIYEKGMLKKRYKISTSKFGLGSEVGSCKTPLGRHEVVSKIGDGLPVGAVLKGHEWNGEVLAPNALGRDPVVSRILWLRGKEVTNRNTYDRLIYIHGTPGRPASHGCVRMGMQDVIKVFGEVPAGTPVLITENRLARRSSDGEAPLEKEDRMAAE